jgi:hypothetical protein
MLALSSIIQKHLKINSMKEINIDDPNVDYWKEVFVAMGEKNEYPFISYFFYEFIYKLYNRSNKNYTINVIVKEKYKILKEMLENIFSTDKFKEDIISFFSNVQKTYNALSRFAYIVKFNKMKVVTNVDLCMNTLEEKTKNVMVVVQNNSKNLFLMSDIINLLNSNLSNAPDFFPEPLVSKNPFNNNIFTQDNLYNIYFFIKKNFLRMPPLIEEFFNCEFNLNAFRIKNEYLIRKISIKNYVYNTPNPILKRKVLDMLAAYKKYVKFKLDKDFPTDILVEVMRPYLHLYYTYHYGVSGLEDTYETHDILIKKFIEFNIFNPKFGRKYVRREPNSENPFDKNKGKVVITFDTNHINFYKKGLKPSEIQVWLNVIERRFVYDINSDEGSLTSNPRYTYEPNGNDEGDDEGDDEDEEADEDDEDDEDEVEDEENEGYNDAEYVVGNNESESESETESVS